MLFSVIIPSYNSAAFIAETLQSLANQICKDFEVIVVDDGSKDNSLIHSQQLLLDLNLKGKAVARGEDRIKGVASCRNLGASLARGEWICFLDSDDLFYPRKLEALSEAIKTGSGSEAIFHAVRYFKDASKETLLIKKLDDHRDIFTKLIKENFICTSTVAVKKSLFDRTNGFNTNLHGVEDYLLWLRLSKHTSWSYINEILTDYRVRDLSLMTNREMTYYILQGKVLSDIVKKSDEFSEEEKRSIEHYMLGSSMDYYASVSLNNRGWNDFLKGIATLVKVGKTNVAMGLLYKHIRFLLLRKMQHSYSTIFRIFKK